MIDAAKAMRDLAEVEISLTEHIRAENRRDPARAAVRLALLEDWLGVLARAQDALRSIPNHAGGHTSC